MGTPRSLVVTIVAAALAAQACITFPVRDAADGAACSKDDECKSHACNEGYCRGSACKVDDPSTCSSGWKCIHTAADPISGFFGATGSTTCHPLCGSCPGNMYCAKEDLARADATCRVGKAPLDVSIAPASGVAGQPIAITAVVAQPAGTITGCSWRFSDGSPEEHGGVTVTHAFKQGGSDYSVSVTCNDDGGRTGLAEGKVTVRCQPLGGACDPTYCCADEHGSPSGGPGSPQCYAGDSPTAHVCRPPKAPTVTIAGPTSVTVDADVKYTVALTGGDAELASASWRFSDDDGFGGGSGPTTTHRFRAAGTFVVTVTAGDGAGKSGDGLLSVTVLPK